RADRGCETVGRAEPLVGDPIVGLAGGRRSAQRRALLRRAGDRRLRDGRSGVDHRRRRGAGLRGGEALLIGGGGDDFDLEALVAFLDLIGRARADRGCETVGRAEPLVGDPIVGLAGGRRSAQRRALLRRAGDRRLRDGRGGVDHRRRRGAGVGGGGALLIGGGRDDFDLEALVAFLDLIGRARADRGCETVGRAEPLVGDPIVGLSGDRRAAQRRALRRRAGDRRLRDGRSGVDHRRRRGAGLRGGEALLIG